MSRLSKLAKAERHYPVPPNGKVLQSEHLRDLTLFVLATVARRRFGEWGLFRPLDCSEERVRTEVNRVTIEGQELVIRNVSIICREGVAIRAEEVRTRFSSSGGEIYLSWNVPGHSGGGVASDGGVTVQLFVGTRPEGTVVVMLGRMVPPVSATATVSRDDVSLSVPALSLDASSDLDEAWSALGATLVELAMAVENSKQGSTFERLEVSESLRSILDMPRHFDPSRAIWELRTTTRRLENFVKGHRGECDNGAEHIAAVLSRASDNCLDGAKDEIDTLIRLIRQVIRTDTAEIVRWLRPSEVLPSESVADVGNFDKLYFRLPEASVTVEVEFSGGRGAGIPDDIEYEIAGEWRRVSEPLEFSDPNRPSVGILKLPTGASRFSIRCESGLKVKATHYPKLTSEPVEPLQADGDAA